MGCIAIWCSPPKPDCESYVIDTHFNLWNLKKQNSKTYTHFIDIGIRLKDKKKPDQINIYLPMNISSEDISDLGIVLKNEVTMQAVFSEAFSVTANPQDKVFIVQSLSTNNKLKVCALDIKKDISISPFQCDNTSGSILSISSLEQTEESDVYYRFRVKSKELIRFVYQDTPPNSWLESAFYIDESIDLKVNDERNLDKSLLSDIRKNGGLSLLNHTHLLIMREKKYDLIFTNQSLATSRPLEEDIWGEYVNGYCCDNMVAYHWKQKADDTNNAFQNYGAYVRYKFWKSSWLTMTLFLLILLAIGFEGSLFAGIVPNVFPESLVTYIATAILVPVIIGVIAVFIFKKSKGKKENHSVHTRKSS